MNSSWRILTAEEQAAIEDTLAEAKEALADAGFPVRTPRFPYSMHHDYYRARLRIHGKKPKHSDVATLLSAWSIERDDVIVYLWQAMAGAVKSMSGSGKTVPDKIASNIARAEAGNGFEPWLSSKPGHKLYGASLAKNLRSE